MLCTSRAVECVLRDRMMEQEELIKVIEKTKQRTEALCQNLEDQLQLEISRLSTRVSLQCALLTQKLEEEIAELKEWFEKNSKKEQITQVNSNSFVEEDNQIKKPKRVPGSASSRREYSLDSEGKRSLRRKKRVNYLYDSDSASEVSIEPLPKKERRRSSTEGTHQLLLHSLNNSHLISTDDDLHPAEEPTFEPLIASPIISDPSQSSLSSYQTTVLSLLAPPSPQFYQFKHYQDPSVVWIGYYQTRPFAISYKILFDFLSNSLPPSLPARSDSTPTALLSKASFIRTSIHNLIREGELVILSVEDESSVFLPLDDEKDSISAKYMLSLPVQQEDITAHQLADKQIILELTKLFHFTYQQLCESISVGNEDKSEIPLFSLQESFVQAVNEGKCRALVERYHHYEGLKERPAWQFFLPPNEIWKMYRRYDMVDITLFYKYLERKNYLTIIKRGKVDHVKWTNCGQDVLVNKSQGDHSESSDIFDSL